MNLHSTLIRSLKVACVNSEIADYETSGFTGILITFLVHGLYEIEMLKRQIFMFFTSHFLLFKDGNQPRFPTIIEHVTFGCFYVCNSARQTMNLYFDLDVKRRNHT